MGDHPDRKLCPVRALQAYLERTKEPEVRHGRTRFLNPKKATFHRRTSPPGSRNSCKIPMSMREQNTFDWLRCQPTMSGSFRHLGQRLTVLHSVRLCKQRTGRARLPLQASISKQWRLKPKGCLRWAPLWRPRRPSSPQVLLRMRKRVFTPLSPSSLPGIESTDSCQLSLK